MEFVKKYTNEQDKWMILKNIFTTESNKTGRNILADQRLYLALIKYKIKFDKTNFFRNICEINIPR
jgi:hypothetical protein